VDLPLYDTLTVPPPFQRLVGKYDYDDAGFELKLPKGWSGFQTNNSVNFGYVGKNLTDLSDVGKQNVSISIMALDNLFSIFHNSNNQSQSINSSVLYYDILGLNDRECVTKSATYDSINGTDLLDIESECNHLGNYTEFKQIVGATGKKLFIVTYKSNSDHKFIANKFDFDQAVSTIKIKNPINMQSLLNNTYSQGKISQLD
jgi:hypothetical protein